MRLALLTHKVDFQDGQGRVNYEIAKAALDFGHSVTVYAEYCCAEIAGHPHGSFVQARKYPIPTQLLRNLYYAAMSSLWLRHHRSEFDLVQANGFVTWQPADIVAVHFVHSSWLRNRSFPFHWSASNPYACYQRLITIINGHYEKRAFRSAKALVAVSRFTASEIAELGISTDKIFIVNNGVDVAEFHPGPSTRSDFGLPEDVPLALFVGDIKTTRKNLETVLASMRSVPEIHLAVVGDDTGSPYPALVKKLNLSDRVHFLGRTSRIAALMRSTDIFVFPSRYEAHPLVLLEALASGLPVVVSENFGASDYIRAGGIVFGDADDVEALSHAMNTLVLSPAKRKAMGIAAREQAMGMQWSQMAAKYLQLYEHLIERKGKRSLGFVNAATGKEKECIQAR